LHTTNFNHEDTKSTKMQLFVEFVSIRG
jgi:hypothetical protein